MAASRKLDVRIHDASIAFWQDDPNDPSFRDDVFIGVLKLLGKGGWSIGPDERIAEHYPVLKKYHRRGEKGDLRMSLRISGRVVEAKLWGENYEGGHPNGNEHGFDKLKQMPYLTRLRVQATHRALTAWAERSFTSRVIQAKNPMPPAIPAMDYIAASYAESWHCDKDLGRPIASEYNSRSGDGGHVEHGGRVWFRGRDGRIRRGTAFTNINNMWFVVTAKDAIEFRASFELLVKQPADLRHKHNERRRRERLEGELAKATRSMDFRRAETLRRILFGDVAPLLIWSKKHNAYYAANCSGYTTDPIGAGKYRPEEAFAEVERVSHILVAMTLDGRQISREAA